MTPRTWAINSRLSALATVRSITRRRGANLEALGGVGALDVLQLPVLILLQHPLLFYAPVGSGPSLAASTKRQGSHGYLGGMDFDCAG